MKRNSLESALEVTLREKRSSFSPELVKGLEEDIAASKKSPEEVVGLDTVRENIAYGRPGATEQEIIDAARRAQADQFIQQMPDGYASQVGERGGHLSVGQRQRIGIARAFLKNAPILLLDEPTSALDPTTESAIMATIKELMKGRTTLIVTHRLATIHNVNQIVVLENGQIMERGRGPELVKRGGVYAKLYTSGNYPS